MHDDDRGPELSPPPATPAIVWRAAPIVVAVLIGAGCGDPGDPIAYDGGPGVQDSGIEVHDAGVQDAGPLPSQDAGPVVHDAGITPPDGSGASE